jgi:hypothetical protein
LAATTTQLPLPAHHRPIAQVTAYFESNGISALLKGCGGGAAGLDALPSLLGMPEVVLPVGFVQSEAGDSETSGVAGAATPAQLVGRSNMSAPPASGGGERSPTAVEKGGFPPLNGSAVAPTGAGSGLRPLSNSVFGPPGADAAVVAVADAFQSTTSHHLQRPTVLVG